MLEVTIDRDVRSALPGTLIGLIEAADARIRSQDPALRTMLEELAERLRSAFHGKVAADRPEIAATRRAYRALGDDPTRYRPANESLLRRVLSRRALPPINTAVDINNYVSLERGFALGCYDASRIAGGIVLRRGKPGEQYAPIGKADADAANRLVLADDQGIFGGPTADSQRTMVTEAANHLLFVLFAFEAEQDAVEQAIERIVALLTRFCGATINQRRILATDDA